MATETWRRGWDLTDEARERFRRISLSSSEAKARALKGIGPSPLHNVNTPALLPESLMPVQDQNGLAALSLFSGGGGLDLGFSNAGYLHVASYEILKQAAATLLEARPFWRVFGGNEGNVTGIDWGRHKGEADVVHGGPPCQPFSAAGRQGGAKDSRDMFPEFVRAIQTIKPQAFVAENVPALASRKFAPYLREQVIEPLSPRYEIRQFALRAEWFGVPQVRKRIFIVGFKSNKAAHRFLIPHPTHCSAHLSNGTNVDMVLPRRRKTMGARQALGLPKIGCDALAPTIRSSLTGPRHTTSVLNSVSAQRIWNEMRIWPNGVAASRLAARAFVAKNGHFRLALPDCAVLQGFPEQWPFKGAVYMALGQIGNAVPPPMAYAVALAVSRAVKGLPDELPKTGGMVLSDTLEL